MAFSSSAFSTIPAFLYKSNRHAPNDKTRRRHSITATLAEKKKTNALQYRKLGDSDLEISEITIGTMTFGEQNTEKEAHEMLSYSFDHGINIIDTAEVYPVPMKKETQGRTDLYVGNWLKSRPRDKVILATKVCGYSERSSYIRDNAKVLRVDAANIKESVEKSLKRLGTDYIDLLQIHWPDRYVAVFGEFLYDYSKWRPSVPFVEQLKPFQDLIDEGKPKLKDCQRSSVSRTTIVCYLGVGLKMSAPWTAMCSVGEDKEKAAKLTVDAVEKIEGELKGKRFFGGESIGYSDIALGWMSYWLPIWEEVGSLKIVDPLQFPALTSWMRNFLEHPVIKENLPPRDKMIIYFQNQRQELTSRPRG